MKIMAVDYGDARTGLAVCDRTETLASPVGIIEEKNMNKALEAIAHAAKEYDVQRIVVGLPINMDGTEGKRAALCRRVGDILAKITALPIVMWDERSSTKQAAAMLGETGTYGAKRKSVLDAVAAVVILEGYLAYRKNNEDGEK